MFIFRFSVTILHKKDFLKKHLQCQANNKNTSKLTLNTPEQLSIVFIVNFGHI